MQHPFRAHSLWMLLLLFCGACSSTPKISDGAISLEEATRFMDRYCSPLSKPQASVNTISGDVVVRSNTRDFKGQYPASVHISKEQEFAMEITNLIGGTVGIIRGNSKAIEVISPGKPHLNRKGISNYLGISAPFFVQLIRGDLPCPEAFKAKVEGSEIVIQQGGQEWRYQRSDQESDSVPVRLRVVEKGKTRVEITIEKWNSEENYAEKMKVQTPEGSLKWNWRSRALEK